MKISEFVDGFKKSANPHKYVTEHIKCKYIPYTEKIMAANKIIAASSYIEINGVKIFKPNTASKYMLFVSSIIQLYTDLEYEKDDDGNSLIIEGFDLIEESGTTEIITEVIGIDVKRFNTVLKMCMDDTIDQERALVPFLDTKFQAMKIGMDYLGESLKTIQEAQEQHHE